MLVLSFLFVYLNAKMFCSLPLQGTVIRVFSVPEGQRLFEFRRGMKRLALVLSSALRREVVQYGETLEINPCGGGMRLGLRY